MPEHPEHHLLGPYIRRFLLEHVVADRNLSRNTQRSYRDGIRVLLRFMTDRHRIDPADLTVEHVTADVVRDFLQHLEQERKNTAATLNQRVTVIHSLFRFVGRHVPELVEHASQLQAVPLRRVDHPTLPYLEKAELDALLATPDRRRRLGQRDYALLLFLYNTGARADEAAQLTRGALELGRPASVRILGKECHAYCTSLRRRGKTTGTHAGQQACALAFSVADVLPVVRRGIGVGLCTDAHGAGRIAPMSEPWAA